MAKQEDPGHIGFNAGVARKRALRMLAIKLDKKNVSELLKYLVDREIEKQLPGELKEIMAEEGTENPKAEHRRQGVNQGARG